LYTRKNQRNLTRSEKRRLVDALLRLKRSGRYDEVVVPATASTTSPTPRTARGPPI
jgi:hypothetical protein